MKFYGYRFFLLIFLFMLSCASDQQEDTKQNNEKIDQKDDTINEGAKEILPCSYDLSAIAPNSSLVIDCLLDLKGETIKIPESVTIEYKGGEIKNGTIAFSDNGKIDGRLLNVSLAITGDVKLISSTFVFIPSQWGTIVEGVTNYTTALKNTTEFESLIFKVSAMGATTFEVDEFDAFFEISTVTSTTSDQNFRPTKEAINLPSNFHLKMSNNTFLRVYTAPADRRNGSLLATRDVENVRISGGNLIGDALTRGYEGVNSNDIGSRLISIHASRSVEVDSVNMQYGSGGGVNVFSLGFPFNPDYIPSENITIKNSTFENIRRMSASITDGKGIKLIGNTFINTGQPINSEDDGGTVGYAINLEPYRERDKEGNLIEYQRLSDVEIQDNKEENSRVGFLIVQSTTNVLVANNVIETRIAFTYSNGVKVKGNTFFAIEKEAFAIFGSGAKSEFTFNNEIFDNTIQGNYGTGISLETKECNIFNNTIKDVAVGVQVLSSINLDITSNTITTSNIGVFINSTTVENIDIDGNTITSKNFHSKLTLVNQESEQKNIAVRFINNNFIQEDANFSLLEVNGVLLKENKINGKVSLKNTSDIEIVSNEIRPQNSDGIIIDGAQKDVSIRDNDISKPNNSSRFECIKNNVQSSSNLILVNNNCTI